MSAFNVGLKSSGLGLAVTDGEALAFICPLTKLRSYLVQCYDSRTKNRVFQPLMVVLATIFLIASITICSPCSARPNPTPRPYSFLLWKYLLPGLGVYMSHASQMAAYARNA